MSDKKARPSDHEPVSINERVVFAVAPNHAGDNIPLVILGIPKDAWLKMASGKTHHFDLTKAGVPVRLMLFGGGSHTDIMKELNEAAQNAGATYRDERRTDFGIDTPKAN